MCRSSNTWVLEDEIATLPIQIYLKQQRVPCAGRLNSLPVQNTIQSARSRIKPPKSGREDIRETNRRVDLAYRSKSRGGKQSKDLEKGAVKAEACLKWTKSWSDLKRSRQPHKPATANAKIRRAAKFCQCRHSRRHRISFQEPPLSLRNNLTRTPSSLAIQIRSEHIGLNSYLHKSTRYLPSTLFVWLPIP